MDIYNENTYDLYKDIKERTGGEIYLGIVGPVRTGKSTFIKRFMDLLVLPQITKEEERLRTQDELPQSASGKTITTTEPKFIPKNAINLKLSDEIQVKIRLIDCVGFLVDGAVGHMEEEKERMVKTPWHKEAIPFTQAAEIGTRKVINDHSTIGIVVTTDGSIGEIERGSYLTAEEKTIMELKKIRKPFVVLVNSVKPYSEETLQLVEEIKEKYQVAAMAINCLQMKKEDIFKCLKKALFEFPITSLEFFLPKWVESLSNQHPVKLDIIEKMANKQCFFDSLARNIYLQFVWAFKSRVRADGIHPCMHEIWMYDGSYMVESDYYNEREWEVLVSSEDNKNFDYNRYICLECGKYFNTPNWKEFEETHFVLKNYDRSSKSISYFRELYYQLFVKSLFHCFSL